MGLIKKDQIRHHSRLGRTTGVGNNQPTKPQNTVQIPVTPPTKTPSESVTLTKVEIPGTEPTVKPLRTPRPGSDMDQMVTDLKDNGHIKHTPVDEAPIEKKTPRPGGVFEEMISNIETRDTAGVQAGIGVNGTIVLLDDSHLVGPNAETYQGPQKALDNIAKEKKAHGHDHGHGHGHTHDALLAKHLGTEVVEQVGHHAHHAGHAADGLHVVAEKGVALKHGLHAVAEKGTAVKHALTQGAELGTVSDLGEAAHSVADGTSKGAHGAGEVVAHGTHGAGEAATHGSHGAGEAAGHGAETAGHLSAGLETALTVGSVASGVLAVPLTYMGVKEGAKGVKDFKAAQADLKQAKTAGATKEELGELKAKRNEGLATIAEGVGTTAVGIRSAAASTVMAGMVSSAPVLGEVASVASKTLTPLGLVHAAVDLGLGARDIYKGNKEAKAAKAEGNETAQKAGKNKVIQGALKVGFGVAVGAAAVGGGIPATVAAIGILGAKTVHKIVTNRKAKKAAKLAEAQAQKQAQALPQGEQQVAKPKESELAGSSPNKGSPSPPAS